MPFCTKISNQVKALLISGVTVIGVATAAAFTAIFAEDRDIGITAWVAVAVVGAASMIATAKNSSANNSSVRNIESTELRDPEESDSRSPHDKTVLISD
ncbi:hypothetical protein Pla110_41640 [Polystyrenella longa]|uniref:Uncharacterized protein n=1 Tax=Polystyrenella longa TaxID=2528007 RepID=A0A518CT60_9PLAN|nr:hypothetical protein [Polystyrenella longa]QDU82409.1 hypothetical protein Pla110_41640 [Polystyrenella longa]